MKAFYIKVTLFILITYTINGDAMEDEIVLSLVLFILLVAIYKLPKEKRGCKKIFSSYQNKKRT